MKPPTASVTADLLAQYDRPGPRYTSYPTAVEFSESFTPQRYVEKLAEAARRPEEPLSVYVHLPFCRERCSFCGCNVIITQKPGVAAAYIDDLEREVDLVASKLGRRNRLVQYHWGGGTPTFLTEEEIERVWSAFSKRFVFEKDAEIAIEVDPRVTTRRQAELLVRLGFNRFSMGVQDFDADVQEAVNRYQTYNQTKDLHEHLRGLGVESINFDFIYGLPKQTPETFRKAIELALTLRPDRVAVYSYAYVPWIKANQKAIAPEELPPREVKLQLFGIAHELFRGAGYQQIGMDTSPSRATRWRRRPGSTRCSGISWATPPTPRGITSASAFPRSATWEAHSRRTRRSCPATSRRSIKGFPRSSGGSRGAGTTKSAAT
ncbi:MAG TPA: oxygen-independent coproporphyrinogen III oxidase [Candidatus Eisenbacteria bacterium]